MRLESVVSTRMGRGRGRVSLPEKGRKRLEEERRQETSEPLPDSVLYRKIQFADGVSTALAARLELRSVPDIAISYHHPAPSCCDPLRPFVLEDYVVAAGARYGN